MRLLTLNGFRGLASGRGRSAPPLSLTPPSEAFARRPDREVLMLEVLAYAGFFVLMFGCLFYVMDSLED